MSKSPRCWDGRLVLLAPNLASYIQGGGHWSWFLQYLLGLRDLHIDFHWIDFMTVGEDKQASERAAKEYLRRIRRYGLEDRCHLILYKKDHEPLDDPGATIVGGNGTPIDEIITSTDVVWSFAATEPSGVLERFRRKILFDVDPGHLQVSALQLGKDFDNYDEHWTVGLNVGSPGCAVPTLGHRWKSTVQAVHLASWPTTVSPAAAAELPITTITHWTWEELDLNGRRLSVSKRDAYLRYLQLPCRILHQVRIASQIVDVPEAEDSMLLEKNGWEIVNPYAVAGSEIAYRQFIQASSAEFCCPKPIHRELATGWISDRSAAYLASGRPVFMEDTSASLPIESGYGLKLFTDMDSAAEAIEEVYADYDRHSNAARKIAEEVFASHVVLPPLLNCSLA
jgi:hypothetical protein